MPAQHGLQRDLMSAGVVEADRQDGLRPVRGVYADDDRCAFFRQSGRSSLNTAFPAITERVTRILLIFS